MTMKINKKWKEATLAVQGGYTPGETGARTLPIYQTVGYEFQDAEHAAELFDLKAFGNIYSRINNPTEDALGEKMALLEGGVGTIGTASGQAAITLALLNICEVGQHIIAASTLYGGTYTLFQNTFKKMGIEVTFVDPHGDLEEISKAFQENTRCIYAETVGNPGLNVLDFEKFSTLSKRHQVPLIVDNTFATPTICKPLELGAHIVVYSATKYIGGHGNAMGGLIIDGGNFDWDTGKYPELTEPDPSYHGMKYVESFGEKAYIIKARVQLLRDIGPTLSPFNAFLLNMGLETLPLRMKKHNENALALAQYLKKHEKVNWVSYPGLEDSPYYRLNKKYLKGSGGMLAFGIKGGLEAGRKFINTVKLASLVANLGDTRTLVTHPASTTHSQLSPEEQETSGTTSDLIRVSVGIEDIEDIINDFAETLAGI